MSAADFLFSPEVQKLLTVLYAATDQQFSTSELAGRAKLGEGETALTVEHLVRSGIVKRQAAKAREGRSSLVSSGGVRLAY